MNKEDKYDTSLILNIVPNYSYGRRLGYTDEEIERLALETYYKMEEAFDDRPND